MLASIASTEQLVEQAVDNEKRTEATLALNQAQLAQQRQQLNVLDSQEKQARATLKAQQAARDLAKIALGYTRIVAPVDGMVSERQVRPGQYVSVGTQVISLVPLPNVWVVANYKETQMTRIRLRQPARVTVDTFPGVVLRGHVDSWSPASGAQFSLLPPDNATGNFTKVVQRIPVKIVLDRDPSLGNLLRPGMSVIATIDTDFASGHLATLSTVILVRSVVMASLATGALGDLRAPRPDRDLATNRRHRGSARRRNLDARRASHDLWSRGRARRCPRGIR